MLVNCLYPKGKWAVPISLTAGLYHWAWEIGCYLPGVYISKRWLPGLGERQSWVVKLAGSLLSFEKHLNTSQRGRDRIYKFSKGNALRKGRRVFTFFASASINFFSFLICICLCSHLCLHHSKPKGLSSTAGRPWLKALLRVLLRTVAWETAAPRAPWNCSEEEGEKPVYIRFFWLGNTCSQAYILVKDYS